MSTLNISLPEVIKHFVEEQVHQGMYASASDYICALVRADQQRQAQDGLEAKLLEALDSGEATEMTTDDWVQIRRDALACLQRRHADPAA